METKTDEKDGEGEEEEEDEDEEEEGKEKAPVRDWEAEYEKRKQTACICTDEARIKLFQNFVDRFVTSRTFNDMALKRTFLTQLAALEKTITTIDYHPGYNRILLFCSCYPLRLFRLISCPLVSRFFILRIVLFCQQEVIIW